MNRNRLVVLFLAVVGLAAALLLVTDPAAESVQPVVEATGGEDPRAGALGAGGDPESIPEVIRTTEPLAGEGPDAEALAAAGAAMRVRVVDDESDEPVPGAVVLLLDCPVREAFELVQRYGEEEDVEAFLQREGHSYRTDRRGEILAPRPLGWLAASASKDSRFAYRIVGLDQGLEELELRLQPDRTVRVRVVDEQGQGVSGVPVALQTRAQNWSRNNSARTTGSDGRAVFRHAQVRLSQAPSRGSSWVAVTLPFEPQVAVKLDVESEDLEKEQLLTIGASGSVRVRVLDYDGRPLTRPVEVNLQAYDAEGGTPSRFRPRPIDGQTTSTSEQGEALFPRIGVGQHLVAGAQLDGSQTWFLGSGIGPAVPGEETVLEVRQNALHPEVVFRVVDPDGLPLAHIPLQCTERTVTQRKSQDRNRTVSTDGEGILRYALRNGPMGSNVSRELEVRYRPARGLPEWRASRDLSQDYPDGSHDLGTLEMRAPALLAAGVVTGPTGETVDGAQVRLFVQREDSRPGRPRWRMERGSEVRSDSSGHFKIFGSPAPVPMELRASHPEYLAGSLSAVTGASDHRIVLDAGRRLHGRVLADDEAMYDNLAVAFVPDGEGNRNRMWYRGGRRLDVEPDGSFDFGALQDKAGKVQVLDRRTGLVLSEVEGVVPWTPEGRPDLRLDPFDLRGSIDVVDLSFRDMEGDPVSDVRFAVTMPGNEDAWWTTARKGGSELYAPPGGVDILVRTDGYREFMVRGVSGTREILLEPAMSVRFELRPSALASEFDLELRIRPDGSEGPRVQPSGIRLQPSGRADAVAPKPGPVHVYLRVRYKDDSGRTQSRYVNFAADGGRRLSVDIRDAAGVQIIPLHVDRQAILAAIGN